LIDFKETLEKEKQDPPLEKKGIKDENKNQEEKEPVELMNNKENGIEENKGNNVDSSSQTMNPLIPNGESSHLNENGNHSNLNTDYNQIVKGGNPELLRYLQSHLQPDIQQTLNQTQQNLKSKLQKDVRIETKKSLSISNDKNFWVRISDSDVSFVKKEEVMSSSAYMLFYERMLN